MYEYHYPGCGAKFNDHISLSNHIFSAHGGNGRMLAVLGAIVLALALLFSPVKADSTEPPSVGDPPTMLHLVYLPLVANGDSVKAAVSWCPSCRY